MFVGWSAVEWPELGWLRELERENKVLWLERAPSFAGKPVGVFVTYAVHPRGSFGLLRRGVEVREGKLVAGHSSRHRDPEAGAADFARRLTGAAA